MNLNLYNWLKKVAMVLVLALSANAANAQCSTGLYSTGCFWGDQIEAFATSGGTTNISNWYSGCGGSSAYTYYSTQTHTIAAGGTVNFIILNNYYYSEYYKIWVDFNADGDFYDTGEQVYQANLGYGSFVSSSFVVPSGTTAGTKRMRVRCVYFGSSSMDPCLSYTYGEVEDYNLVVTGGSGCTGTPAPGNTLSTLNPVCPATSFTLSLQNTTAGSGVSYQWQSSPNNSTWTNISGATSSTLTTTQTSSTYYRCGVTCSSNTGFSNSLQVNMNSFLSCYCVAGNSSGCVFNDVINNVTFGTLNNTTGCTATPAYTDYGTSVAAPNISIGSTTPISVTVGAGGTERVACWIDYNQNGVFETTEFTSIGSGNGSVVTNSVVVPATATAGLTKMRVRVRWSTTILNTDPCTTFTYGETEDYNVNLVCTAPSFTTHPVSSTLCAGSNLTLTAAATGSGLTYQWQVNTGTGFTNVTNGGVYSGATTGSLLLTLPPSTFNGYQYRCIAAVSCSTITATSNIATLSVGAPTAVLSMTPNTTACNGTPAVFTVNAGGTNLTYQWQVYDGTGYYNLSNAGIYSGVNTATLNISAVSAGMNGYGYRVVLGGSCPPLTLISQTSTLSIGSGFPIITQPANFTVCSGNTANFSVATGGANVAYQWQVNTGSGFANVSNGTNYGGATTATLSVLNTPIGFNTYQYRCVVSNTCTTPFFSNTATLSVQPAPVITSQPVSATTCDYQGTSFSVAATGAGLTYQWQVNTGLGFVNLTNAAPYSGVFTPTLGLTNVLGSMTGYQYQCVITGNCTPSVVTNTVTLNVNTRPVITSMPVNSTVCENSATTYSVTATGSALTYQWQVDNGTTYVNLTNTGVYSGVTTSVLSLSGIPNSLHGRAYRCVVGGTCSPAQLSNNAMLYVNSAPTVFSQPGDRQVCAGSAVTFTATGTAATITGALSYQWQVNTGSGFTNLVNGAPYSNVTTANMTITGATIALNGYTYRCVISNQSCTPSAITSNSILTVNTLPAITTQPNGQTVCPGTVATFTVAATGTGATYQWQENNGTGYVNIGGSAPYTGSNTPVLSISNISLSMQGYLYRCVVRGTCAPPVTTAAVVLNVLNPITINSSSITDTVCEGGVVKLGVRAAGAGVMYQWQRMQTNGTFVNLANIPPYSATNTDSLRISGVPNSLHGSVYRCVLTETQLCGLSYFTTNIPLGVRSAPVSSPTTLTATPYQIATFAVPPTGTSYQWQENDNSGNGYRNLAEGGKYSGVYTNTLRISMPVVTMNGNMYRCMVDGVCTSTMASTSSELLINPILSVNGVQKNLGIDVYPNPMTGNELNISFKQMMSGNTEVKVLDKLGKVVYTDKLLLDGSKTAKINLTSLAAGVYMLQIVNADESVSETIQFVKK